MLKDNIHIVLLIISYLIFIDTPVLKEVLTDSSFANSYYEVSHFIFYLLVKFDTN